MRPFPERSAPVSFGGQAFRPFRSFSDSRIAAGRSLRHISQLAHNVAAQDLLEVTMDHVALFRQLFRQFYLVIVQKVWIGYDNDRDSDT